MDRAAAITIMQQEYEQLAADVKFTTQQVTDAYNFAVDMALRELDVLDADLQTAVVEQADIKKFLALLNYFLLKRYVRIYGIKYDVAAGGGAIDAKRSQAYKQMKELLSEAAEECAGLGVPVGPGAGDIIQSGRMSLGYLSRGYCRSEF